LEGIGRRARSARRTRGGIKMQGHVSGERERARIVGHAVADGA
jgi:hypothetical protein